MLKAINDWVARRYYDIAARRGIIDLVPPPPELSLPRSGGWAAILFFGAFVLMVYGFALAYVATSLLDPKAFNVGYVDLVSGIYFSVVTIATVGYGDIVPTTRLAKVLVTTEFLLD